jgi:hypothetical protein
LFSETQFQILGEINPLQTLNVVMSTKSKNQFESKQVWLTTVLNDKAKGNVFYLDRHDVKCIGPNNALAQFQLATPNTDQMNYKFQCIHHEAIGAPGIERSTNFNATSGNMSANYLDRHLVQCPVGQALTRFQLKRDTNDNKKIHYVFNCTPIQVYCCKTDRTKATSAGDHQTTDYLDRQLVGISSKHSNKVLTGFQLHSTYKPNKYYYTYSYCTLLDLEAKKRVAVAEANVKAVRAHLATKVKAVKLAKASNHAEDLEIKNADQWVKDVKKNIHDANASLTKGKEDILKAERRYAKARATKLTNASKVVGAEKVVATAKHEVKIAVQALTKERSRPILESGCLHTK